MPAPDLPGLITADQIRVTAAHIADWQLPSGMIPWFPGGHADPWNHIEAAMALAIGEHRAEAEAAYQWLVDCQRPDGSWHQYYLEHEIEQDKLDANVIAYIATGVWHHFLLYRDPGFIESMWPVVDQAIRFVLDLLQSPRTSSCFFLYDHRSWIEYPQHNADQWVRYAQVSSIWPFA